MSTSLSTSVAQVIDVPPPCEVKPPPTDFKDPCSFSHPGKIFTRHFHINLHVDLQQRRITSTVQYTFEILDTTIGTITLDMRGIAIDSIRDVTTGRDLSFEINQPIKNESVGEALVIALPEPEEKDTYEKGDRINVQISYETDGLGGRFTCGGACDWLNASQAGGYPFIFTQAQSIHARTLLPCQDTPAVKSTYSSLITLDQQSIQQGLQVVMSAIRISNEEHDDKNSFRFQCPVPIPSYLFAFAVGKLKFKDISNRCRIWALPDVIDKAKWEFQNLELFLQTAEKIAGPYVWGRYDLLILPSSFCYGGMENPMLTFVTPTLLSGDRSLVSVVIHEIAHSWTGNLVSCQDTRHFWLNEGFTVKLERRILRELYGIGREGLDTTRGRQELNNFIESVGETHEYTSLITPLKPGDDPDDFYSRVAYEKGFNLLLLLQEYVKEDYEDEEKADIDIFFKDYYQKFQYQSISSMDFVNYFKQYYPKTFQRIDFHQWLSEPGYCPNVAQIDMTFVEEAKKLTDIWIDYFQFIDDKPNEQQDKVYELLERDYLKQSIDDHKKGFLSWDPTQQLSLLSNLGNAVMVVNKNSNDWWNEKCMHVLNHVYNFNNILNSEMRFWWCKLGIYAKWNPIINNVKQFLISQGRMKFVRPLFKDLKDIYPSDGFAETLFKEVKPTYHSLATKMIERDLQLV